MSELYTILCIESTKRSAYDKGFEVYTVTDCMTTLGKEQQRSTVEYNFIGRYINAGLGGTPLS